MRRRLVELIGVAVVLAAVIGLLERAQAPGGPATGRDNATGGGTIGDPLGR